MHHVAIEIRRTLSLTKWFSAGGWDSWRDRCRKHINESSPSLKPQTSFHPPQKKPCVPVGVAAGIVKRSTAVARVDIRTPHRILSNPDPPELMHRSSKPIPLTSGKLAIVCMLANTPR